jgi:hypothetical protein
MTNTLENVVSGLASNSQKVAQKGVDIERLIGIIDGCIHSPISNPERIALTLALEAELSKRLCPEIPDFPV